MTDALKRLGHQFVVFAACVVGWLGLCVGLCGLIYFIIEADPVGFVLTLVVSFLFTKAALWSTKIIFDSDWPN